MKKTLLFIFALTLATSLFAQSNVYLIQEGFNETTLPSTWTTMGSGVNNWYISTSNIAGGKPNEVNLQWTPPFNGTARLVSPAVNLSNVTSAVMTLKHYPSFFGNTGAKVGVATSSDNGTTWNSVWSEHYNTNAQYTILENITSPDMGKNNVLFCIYFEGNSYNISNWYFDDFEVYTIEDLSVELVSIDVPSIVNYGDTDISFTIKNSGNTDIETLKARYTINDETVEQTFYAHVTSMNTKQLTFSTALSTRPNEKYNIEVEIVSVNDDTDDTSDNILSQDVISAMSHTQMTPMIEHFSSSTCNPCVAVNNLMAELTANHEGEYTYTKYTSNGPALGDPYYTAEGGTRMTYYNVLGVPQTFLNGADQGYGATSEESFMEAYNSPAFADVRGSYTIEGNNINITADFMSYFDMDNVRAFISVNEKTTTDNASSNGETEFHHVMMKMLENAEGNVLNIKAGEYQRLVFSYDMSSTFVEEMNDLEVALWLQDYETKVIYNSHFAYENTGHCYPVQNMQSAVVGDCITLYIDWDAPEAGNPIGYNIYVDGELIKENITECSYEDAVLGGEIYESPNAHIAEVVALYENGMTSVAVTKIIGDDWINVAETKSVNVELYPNPAKDFIKISAVNGEVSAVKVYNYLGILFEEIEASSNEIEINTSAYNTGIYFINIETSNGNVTKKVVVE